MDVFIIRDGEQIGPFEDGAVQSMLAEGQVSHEDYAWRTGMSAWIPLREVMGSAVRNATPPPAPAESGIRRVSDISVPPKQHAKSTAKQRAILAYLGIKFSPDISKEKAAVLVSDALEDSRLYSRLAKWSVEKFKLHPDIFADELDAKKQHRAAHYHELCQIEGKEIVQNITEAHCKVLIESLDNRFPSWEVNPKESLWDYFLPMLNEHFPQLVSTEWRQRLKMGGTKLPGALTHALPASAKLQRQQAAPPSQFKAAVRGLVYGLVLLGAIIGAMIYLQKSKQAADGAVSQDSQGRSAEATTATEAAPVAGSPTSVGAEELVAANPTPATATGETAAEMPAPEAVTDASATPADIAAATPPAPRETVTLKKAVEIQLQYGKVKLNAGMRLKFIAQEGDLVRADYKNTVILLPVKVTDLADAAQ